MERGRTFLGRRGDRDALALALGLWTLFYGLQALQSAFDREHIGAYALWGIAAMGAVSLVGSAAIYVAVRAGRAWTPPLRIAALVMAVVAVSLAHAVINALLGVTLHAQVFNTQVRISDTPALAWPRVKLAMVTYGAPTLVWTYGMYALGLSLMSAAAAARERELQLVEARAAADQARLEALRFQLNPHFLFNTLNAISSLMVSNRPEQAERMLDKLSDFLRTTLTSDARSVTPLAEELDALEAYLEIENVRFGDRMAVQLDCPPELRAAAVPGLILQPLVENAVKYAVAPARRPVTIRVAASAAAERLVLVVTDDGEGRPAGRFAKGAGVGLANVRRRLEVLYGPEGRLETGVASPGFWARVTLPLTMATP